MSDMIPHPVGSAARRLTVFFFSGRKPIGTGVFSAVESSMSVGRGYLILARLGCHRRSPFSVFTVRSMSRPRVKGCRSRALVFTTTITVHELTASVYLICILLLHLLSVPSPPPPVSRPFNPVNHISGHDGAFSLPCLPLEQWATLSPFPPFPRHRCVYTPR